MHNRAGAKDERVFHRQIWKAALLLPVLLIPGQMSAQTPFFKPGNLVVAVEGCGVHGGTCTSVRNGKGTGAGNSSAGGYGDNQASPLTLFQYVPSGTSSVAYVNALTLPQAASGANLPVSGEYGSSSEATLQLSGAGQYLMIMGYGVDALSFNANPDAYGAAPSQALGQSGSLTGQELLVTARPRERFYLWAATKCFQSPLRQATQSASQRLKRRPLLR